MMTKDMRCVVLKDELMNILQRCAPSLAMSLVNRAGKLLSAAVCRREQKRPFHIRAGQ